MGDSDENSNEAIKVDVVYSVHSVVSSEDPPIEEWSSLEISLPEENKKKNLFNEGLYDPGSGEICAQYIATSASSVLRHPYYNYPAILNPGIKQALLDPEDTILYPHDGQALYLALCKEMNQCPVRSFYRGLLENEIDLRYYCINPNGFRAMAKALEYNKMVGVLNLTDNFLNDDACYHMGDMLVANNTLTEINLRGCRIGPQGARRLFCSLHLNRALKILDLSYNKLGDDGMQYIARSVLFGLNVKNLNLSYNSITGKGVALLEEPFETHNNFTHLNFSWNKIFTPGGSAFLVKLSESTVLEGLNLSWNSLSGSRVSYALKSILLCPLLTELNLSNNKLDGEAIKIVTANLAKATKLKTLNLSYNPLSPKDALEVLNKVAMVSSKVTSLLMENVMVNAEFLILLENTTKKKSKKNLVVSYGGIVSEFKAKGPDTRELVLNRVEYVTSKMKKTKPDIALITLQLQKDRRLILNEKELSYALRTAGALLDEDLLTELCIAFSAPSNNPKMKNIDINLMADYVKRKWPDRELPVTPPPEPERELEPEPPKPTGKGKGKGKK